MRLRSMRCLLAAVLLLGSAATPVLAVDKDAIIGQWYTEAHKALVSIYSCDQHYCGRIIWLKEPRNPDGTEKVDVHNPDQRLRREPIIGLQLVSDFTFEGNKKWTGGKIYDPESGKTYSCKMVLEGDQQLKVRGYIGVPLLGRTEIWTRTEQSSETQ
jgi:uncharacterized protein (DUF2147 family)